MNETTLLIRDMTERLLREGVDPQLLAAAEDGHWPAALWRALVDSGLPALLAGESGWRDAHEVVQAAGRHALPLPLPECLAAHGLLAAAGMEAPDGLVGLAGLQAGDPVRLRSTAARWRADGCLRRVPWGRQLSHVVFHARVGDRALLACAAVAGTEGTRGANLVGEPRDDLVLRDQPVRVAPWPARLGSDLRALGALLRAAQMAGAIAAVLEQAVAYARERQQFGRPIAGFQAVQHLLAVLAEESAAATMAAEQGFLALDAGADPGFAAAVAKVRTGEAAGQAARIAHEVLGAMGFTREHPLHHWTRRLWAWRAECGNEAEWSGRLAALLLPAGAAGLWPRLTSAYAGEAVQ